MATRRKRKGSGTVTEAVRKKAKLKAPVKKGAPRKKMRKR
jgi:hypothetical protein